MKFNSTSDLSGSVALLHSKQATEKYSIFFSAILIIMKAAHRLDRVIIHRRELKLLSHLRLNTLRKTTKSKISI